jgi:hypothetical protein
MKYIITESQYSFLVGDRNPRKGPLNEGRKEELLKKYGKSYEGRESILNSILNEPLLTSFNHKYTDFLLRNFIGADLYGLGGRINDAAETIKTFDKYRDNLEKKDINQYENFTELESALRPFVEKSEQKKLEGQVKKIYEDDRYLVIIPETKDASCKYGANTKWCVTMRDKNYYEQYTKGKQKLYFIIDKQNSRNDFFSKVAVHYDDYKNRSLWDSKDERLTSREISILEYAFPQIFEAIKEDYETPVGLTYSFFEELFNQESWERFTIGNMEQGKLLIEVTVGYSELFEDHGISMDCYILAISYGKNYEIGNYYLYGNWDYDDKTLNISFILEETDALDLGLQNYEFNIDFPIVDDIKKMDKEIKQTAAMEIFDAVVQDRTRVQKILDFIDSEKEK